MLQSMTGFGRASGVIKNKRIIIEIRSLNSKGTDLYVKIPNAYKSYELPIRKMITDGLVRGKIECFIAEEPLEGANVATTINEEAVKIYYRQMAKVARALGEETNQLLPVIMRMPDVLQTQDEEVSEEEWGIIQGLVNEAINQATEYRINEGKTLVADFTNCIDEIERLLEQVPQYEDLRIEIIKDRLRSGLEKLGEKYDENRFEQELIYYIEKIDISEEKTRLQHHIVYFRETIIAPDSEGKKLGFISQEIGREINTLGSKSYHAELQKIVVQMKDNLEKIKEQVLNTL